MVEQIRFTFNCLDIVDHVDGNNNHEQERRKRYFCYLEIPKVPLGVIRRPSVFPSPILHLHCLFKIAKDEVNGQPIMKRKYSEALYPPVINFAVIHAPFIPDSPNFPKQNAVLGRMIKDSSHKGDIYSTEGDSTNRFEQAYYKAVSEGHYVDEVCGSQTAYDNDILSSPDFSPCSYNQHVFTNSPSMSPMDSDSSRPYYVGRNADSCMKPIPFENPYTGRGHYGGALSPNMYQQQPNCQPILWNSKPQSQSKSPNLYSICSPMTTPEEYLSPLSTPMYRTLSLPQSPMSTPYETFPIQETSDYTLSGRVISRGSTDSIKVDVKRKGKRSRRREAGRSSSESATRRRSRDGSSQRLTRPKRRKMKRYYVYCEIPKIQIGDSRRSSIVLTNKLYLHCLLQEPLPNTYINFSRMPLLKYVRPRINFAVIHRTLLIDPVEFAKKMEREFLQRKLKSLSAPTKREQPVTKENSYNPVKVTLNPEPWTRNKSFGSKIHDFKKTAGPVQFSGDISTSNVFSSHFGFNYGESKPSKYGIISDWKLSKIPNQRELVISKMSKKPKEQ